MVKPNVPGTSCTPKFPLLGSWVLPPLPPGPSPYPSLASCHPQGFSRRQVHSLRAVFCGSATLTVIPCSCFGLLQPLSWCLLLPPGAQLPVWGGLDRDGRVHASARLLNLQPLGAEEDWRRRPAVPRPSRLLFVSRVSEGERGRWCPCGWAWKPLCCRAGAARLCFLCPVCRPWHGKRQIPARSFSANMEGIQSLIWGSLSYLQPLNRQSVLARKVFGLLHCHTNNLGNEPSL